MFLPSRLYQPLAQMDDGGWQGVLDRHAFWQVPGSTLDAEHQDVAFHILMNEGQLALPSAQKADSRFGFDAIQIPPLVFEDAELVRLTDQWSAMHQQNFGVGVTVKMGLYVIRAGGILGFHVDGPVFLNGMRVDLSTSAIQRGLIETHASRRTVLPLRFNPTDDFMLCEFRAPMKRGELFEFNNVLPHAYFNRGGQHAVLLVTTYLVEELLPVELTYGDHRTASTLS